MRRLLDLGLTKGCTFTVVQGSRGGPVLVEVRGTRIALGHGLAESLIVEEVGTIN
jgi:Fe2+ transport system protein FeoA